MRLTRRQALLAAAGAAWALRVNAADESGNPLFEQIAPETSGIRWVHDNAMSDMHYLPETMGRGVAFLDYDNDGWMDLYLVNSGPSDFWKPPRPIHSALYKNNRDGTFTDVTAKAGVAGNVFGMGVAVGDYNNDGFPDMFVSAVGAPKLYRNNGDGTFTDVSSETGIATVEGKGMGVVFADYDGDGFMDVFVANDNSPNLLFHNLGGKKFEEVAFTAGVAYNEDGNQLAGMGADFRDVDNDGLPDIWHTAIENETFPLFRNLGRGQFGNVTQRSRLAQLTREMSGWSNGAADLDNDGWKDLFVARGNVMDDIDAVSKHFHYAEPNAVFRNLGNGQFEDVSAAAGADFTRAAPHRGLAYGDLDNDGRIDLVVTQLRGPVQLFHNVSENQNHWLLLKLIGTRSNRMGIGAQIRVTTGDGQSQYNEVTTSTGYAASSDPRVHFGLGRFPAAREIEIRWPSGVRQSLRDVKGDRIVAVTEPETRGARLSVPLSALADSPAN